MHIIHCTEDHVDQAAGLFNDYRMFYEQPSDLPACRTFLRENLVTRRSRLLLLCDDASQPVAFSQLYPATCSVAMRPYFHLSDLYVAASARGRGHARYLMDYITRHVAREGAHRLTLETATTNHVAQRLYESLGYERDPVFLTYHLLLDGVSSR
ncbi:MAG: N-acetyltransferase family protein [Rhizobacter sp.]|jgi:ribosomal protein S18 acetylase RimI-like enzyme